MLQEPNEQYGAKVREGRIEVSVKRWELEGGALRQPGKQLKTLQGRGLGQETEAEKPQKSFGFSRQISVAK